MTGYDEVAQPENGVDNTVKADVTGRRVFFETLRAMRPSPRVLAALEDVESADVTTAETCGACRHALHTGACLNAASDNDCACSSRPVVTPGGDA